MKHIQVGTCVWQRVHINFSLPSGVSGIKPTLPLLDSVLNPAKWSIHPWNARSSVFRTWRRTVIGKWMTRNGAYASWKLFHLSKQKSREKVIMEKMSDFENVKSALKFFPRKLHRLPFSSCFVVWQFQKADLCFSPRCLCVYTIILLFLLLSFFTQGRTQT